LAFGDTETLMTDVLSFIRPTTPNLAPPDRIALVHVIHVSGTVGAEIVDWEERWGQFFSQQAASLAGFRYAIDVVPLVEPLKPQLTEVKDSDVDDVQRLAASLAGFGAWARTENRPYDWLPKDTPPLEPALWEWRQNGESSLFHISSPVSGALRGFGERDVLEQNGAVVLTPQQLSSRISNNFIAAGIGATCMLLGFDQSFGGPNQWEPIGKWLLAQGRIFLFVDCKNRFSWEASDIIKATQLGARIVLVNPGSLPEGFERITFVTAPLPAPSAEVEAQKQSAQS
jgi:hypothetical protein